MKFKNLPTSHSEPIPIEEALKDKEKGVYLFTAFPNSFASGDLFIIVWENKGSAAGYASYIKDSSCTSDICDWEGYLVGELTLSLDNPTPSM